jgi:Ni/Fe-hydrogenase subunit HybB-like protein
MHLLHPAHPDDLATVRDLAQTRRQQILYGILALGWRGSARHWRNHQTVYFIMCAIMAPMVISVHSVVGLDFAGGLTPGWHSTQFPPYFFFGAVISGLALVLMLTILVRRGYGFQDIITEYHLNALAKVMLVGSVMLGYSYLWEAWGPIYGSNIADRSEFFSRIFGFYAASYWAKIVLNILIPQLLWLPAVRRNEVLLFLISLGIIVGMWLERFVIVITSLHRDFLPSSWSMYWPTVWDWAVYVGTLGFFMTCIFLFIRVLPMITIFELRMLLPGARVKEPVAQ